MQFHRNAKLGLAGRHELVLAIERGSSIRRAAEGFHVSPATAHRWWRRWQQAGAGERVGLACLCDRSSRPARSPRRLDAASEQTICDCRRKTGWGPRLITGATGFAHSTVWKVLRRFGLSRPPRPEREPANRYEWPCPGDLLHMDTSRYARFLRPGHRVTGDRSQRLRGRSVESRLGYDFVHAIVDDHSRLAYAETPPRRESPDRHRLPRASARLLRRARHHRQTSDERQRLGLRPQPITGRTARPAWNPAPQDRALPAPDQRQGRALPPNDGAGMGLRTQLPLTPTTATAPCQNGSTTTTGPDPTARSQADPQSAAFTTYVGRTPSQLREQAAGPDDLLLRPGTGEQLIDQPVAEPLPQLRRLALDPKVLPWASSEALRANFIERFVDTRPPGLPGAGRGDEAVQRRPVLRWLLVGVSAVFSRR